MPVIKSAKKKLRKDKKREIKNKILRESLKKAIKGVYKKPTQESIKKATKIADKASKSGIIHKNKANRIKSKFSKLMPKSISKTKGQKSSSKAKK